MSVVTGLVVIVAILAVTMTIWLLIQRGSNVGSLIIEPEEESGKIVFRLELDADPFDLVHMNKVSFKVVNKQKTTE